MQASLRSYALILATSITVVSGVSRAQTVEPAGTRALKTSMSEAAGAYLAAALDTLQAVVVRSDTISWTRVRDSAFLLARGAMSPRDTYGAIAWALHRANHHGFLQAAHPGAVSELVDDVIGYVHVPQWAGPSVALADSLQSALASLDQRGACGWIVDLRANNGGNMWPMLAGIGPLLDDTIVGAFGITRDADRWFYKSGVAGMLHPNGKLDTVTRATVRPTVLRDPRAPVAVLLDGATASSGEAIALAFRGRPSTRSFGVPTAGFVTANRGALLSDGANMVVTTGYQIDRRGLGGERIEPDSLLPGGISGWPFPTDAVATVAAEWLRQTPACRRFRP